MTPEEEGKYILDNFQTAMKKYSGKRIALYGLGINSEYIVKNQTGINIVALMDARQEGAVLWGLPIYSKEQAQENVDVLVIVAKRRSIPIIYERVAELAEQHIVIVDVSGNPINTDRIEYEIEKNPYFDYDYIDLLERIKQFPVITFDIFDTLLMRKILLPENIFEVVERAWETQAERGESNYAKYRMQAQKSSYQKHLNPTYEQIYEELALISDFSQNDIEALQKLEYDIEMKYIVPRDRIKELLETAWDMGKKIYLISDMYYSAEQIKGFLQKCGIEHYHGIVVSSEEKCQKWPDGKLFLRAAQKYNYSCEQSIHIGDNVSADIECAAKHGCEVFHIWNAKQMLEDSYLRSLLVHVTSLEDSIVLGMYMAVMLNDPFALNKNRGRLIIDSKKKIGYGSYGILITEYLHWLLKKSIHEKIDKILFMARDGYIPQKMYQTIVEKKGIIDAPVDKYVYVSRGSLMGAAVYEENDIIEQIEHLERVGFSAGDVLLFNYGVEPEKDDVRTSQRLNDIELQEYLLSYNNEILAESKRKRVNFLKYLHSIGIRYESESDIMMDSLTAGTSVYYYRKITGANVKLEALMLKDVVNFSQYDKNCDEGFLGNDTIYLMKTGFTRSHMLHDSVLTSPELRTQGINELLEPIFSGTNDPDEQGINPKEMWVGMEQFGEEYMELTPYDIRLQKFSIELCDTFFDVLFGKGCILSEGIQQEFESVEIY